MGNNFFAIFMHIKLGMPQGQRTFLYSVPRLQKKIRKDA